MQFTKVFLGFLAAASAQATTSASKAKGAWLYEWQPTGDYCPPRPASAIEQQSIFNAFVRTFYKENNITASMTNYVATDYIQHNPYVLSGRQNAIDFLVPYTQNFTFTVEHIGFESNMGWVHVKVESPGAPVTAIFDLYRMNGTCVQEHWDVIQALPAGAPNRWHSFNWQLDSVGLRTFDVNKWTSKDVEGLDWGNGVDRKVSSCAKLQLLGIEERLE